MASCWTWAGDAKPATADERSPVPFRTRVDAVATAGWYGVGLVHADLIEVAATICLATARKMLADNGINHIEVEFLGDWWADGDARSASDRIRHELFDAAAILGATTVKVGPEVDHFRRGTGVDPSHFIEQFDALATDAGRHGVRVALEPMPMSNVRTIADGADVVTAAGNPDGGLAVDIWHVARSGTDYLELPGVLDPQQIFVVELNDAAADVIGSLWDDTLDRRLDPGDGSFDVARFVRVLHDLGWSGPWGVEIISSTHRSKDFAAAVTDAHEKTLAVIDTAQSLGDAR